MYEPPLIDLIYFLFFVGVVAPWIFAILIFLGGVFLILIGKGDWLE